MFHLAAIILFILSVIFYAWSLGHGVWNYILFALLALTCWCISAHPKSP